MPTETEMSSLSYIISSPSKLRDMDIVGQMYKVAWPDPKKLFVSTSSHFAQEKEKKPVFIPTDKPVICEKLDRLAESFDLFDTETHIKDDHGLPVEGSYSEDAINQVNLTINEEIKSLPVTFHMLRRCIRNRTLPRNDVFYINESNQILLAEMLIDEVRIVLGDVRQQIDDPFLTREENKEMLRRIYVCVAMICVDIYNLHITKAQIYHDRRVFTDFANICRLRAEISVQCHKLLNIRNIRRYAIATIRLQHEFTTPDVVAVSSQKHEHKDAAKRLSMIELELNEAMPSLNRAKYLAFMCGFSSKPTITESIESHSPCSKTVLPHIQKNDSTLSETVACLAKRSGSVPGLIVPELDMISRGYRSSSSFAVTPYLHSKHVDELSMENYIHEDLKQLVKVDGKNHADSELPALIEAMVVCHRKGARDKYQLILKKMEEEKKREMEAKRKTQKKSCLPPVATHIQPSTVQTVLPNKMLMKVYDARVSSRVCVTPKCLVGQGPIYNELLGEIDAKMIKEMDKHIYLKREIHEVYREMMKSMNPSFQQMDHDSLVERSSANFHLPRKSPRALCTERSKVVNTALVRKGHPPWGKSHINDWCRTPEHVRGAEHSPASFVPDLELLYERYHTSNESTLDNVPRSVREKTKRMFEVWLSTWKDMINFTDYIKYLCTKRTDYVGVIFHLYETEDDNESQRYRNQEEADLQAALDDIDAAEKAHMDELKRIKYRFQAGVWNTSSISMGGLGGDPYAELEEVIASKSGMSLSSYPVFSTGPKYVKLADRCAKAEKELPFVQRRLEEVWRRLKIPEAQRLDMAIKYSSTDMNFNLKRLLLYLESIARQIEKREEVLSRLEKFERTASDPDRFFHKGPGKTFEEADARKMLLKELHYVSNGLEAKVLLIEKKFGDIVTYNGRPYIDKMKWDKIEMKYWLQEERKQNAICCDIITHDRRIIHPAQLRSLFMS